VTVKCVKQKSAVKTGYTQPKTDILGG